VPVKKAAGLASFLQGPARIKPAWIQLGRDLTSASGYVFLLLLQLGISLYIDHGGFNI
jgi:hypothetical protein